MNFEDQRKAALQSAERLQNDPEYLAQCIARIFEDIAELKRDIRMLRGRE